MTPIMDAQPRASARRLAALIAAGAIASIVAGAGSLRPAAGQSSRFYDREAIPGHYTIGLYADGDGQMRTVRLAANQETFDAFVGLTGDSLQQFSACTFDLKLPPGLSTEGAFRWRPIPGLEQWGGTTDEGVRVEFADSCQAQRGGAPAMLGKVRLRASSKFRKGQVEVTGHKKYGCSVELCTPGYPKPFATGLALDVRRDVSLLQRIRDLF